MSASRRKEEDEETIRDLAIALGFMLILIGASAFLGAVFDRYILSPGQPSQVVVNIPQNALPNCNVMVVGNNAQNTPVSTPDLPSGDTLTLSKTYPDNSTFNFNCSSPSEVNWVTHYLANLIPYKMDHYDCTQFSRALIANLTHYGCTARMVKGWYQPSMDNSYRSLHDWVETPDFIIEATPNNDGILNISTYGLHYSKIQTYDWNLSTLCGE